MTDSGKDTGGEKTADYGSNAPADHACPPTTDSRHVTSARRGQTAAAGVGRSTTPARDAGPRRVLMTCDSVGGVWTYALELCKALGRHGVGISLATMGDKLAPAQRGEVAALPNVEIHESRFRLEWMENPWDDVRRAGDWLLEIAARSQPDLVHLNGYAHASLPWPVPALVVAHSDVLSWYAAVKHTSPPPEWNVYRERVRDGLRQADAIAAPTRWMLDTLYRHYGPLPPGRVVWNGRDERRLHPRRKHEYFFSMGRAWDEAKNLAALDRVAPELPWPTYLAGPARDPRGGVVEPRHVRMLGTLSVDLLSHWLGGAPVYVLPARYEPFGLSVLEAAGCECALVLNDLPSLREIWEDAAWWIDADDDRALSRACRALAERPDLRRDLGRRAARRAENLSAAVMADGYLSIYADLLSSRRQPAAEFRSCAS